MAKKNNIIITVLAVIIAILLRSYVVNKDNPERTIEYRNIPVTFTNEESLKQAGLTVIEPSSATVNVKLTGRLKELGELNSKKIMASFDFTGYQEGKINIPINVKLMENPGGVRIAGYEPKDVMFTIEQIISRTKDVEVVTSGNTAEGYRLNHVATEIQIATISGPRSAVNQVAKVLAPIDIDGWTKTNTVSSELKAVDDEGREVLGVTLDVSRTKVTGIVYKIKEVPVVVQTEGEISNNIEMTSLTVAPSKIKISGPEEAIDLENIKTKALDLNEVKESGSKTLSLIIPTQVVAIENVLEVRIDYTVEKMEEIVLNVPLSVIKIRSDQEISTEWVSPPESLSMKLRGTEEKMKALDYEGFSFFVETDGTKGIEEVQIQVEGVPKEIEWSIDPSALVLDKGE